ncbi:trigger factor-like isoform X1 [Schistocerca gregaria]|uniref:trigger factor-like isoform X1 n=1 Tax=Schistocerca gregaria TaxID=7010 RepID=UPI00211F2088|nr:trigger factor-like isoform X1 [Schistocerca gregaria]
MKVALVLLISGVLLVAYSTPLAAADDGDEVFEDDDETDSLADEDADDSGADEVFEDDDETDSLADEDADDSGADEGLTVESRKAVKGAHARAGHAKHARAGSRHAASRAANRPHARSGAARKAAHSV